MKRCTWAHTVSRDSHPGLSGPARLPPYPTLSQSSHSREESAASSWPAQPQPTPPFPRGGPHSVEWQAEDQRPSPTPAAGPPLPRQKACGWSSGDGAGAREQGLLFETDLCT